LGRVDDIKPPPSSFLSSSLSPPLLLLHQVPFGILPGGSEEIIITERGKENVFIKNRAGFIKYALQHGYTITLG